MIVTFHIVVYLAYRVWENCIVPVFFRNDDNGLDTNENSHNINTSPANTASNTQSGRVNAISDNEPNLNSRNETTMSKVDGSRQVKEGDGDLNSSLEDDIYSEGTTYIYSTKPKYECLNTEEKGLRFIPPVYTQRYMIIEGILQEPCWVENVKKVVDFGCAELSFELKHLKKLFGINEIIAVDIDSALLSYNHCKMSPTTTDYLDPRPSPLTVRVFCGSCAKTNQILINTDAVIAIELVEHLYPPELDCLPFTIFGFIKPKIAMFTTPNADFNVLFPNFSGFRHLDHKFEWSRQQFEDWGKNLVVRYPDYTVTFQGVGPGPVGTEHLGCCSQMATFVKVHESQTLTEDEISVQDGPYELIHEYTYPCFVDKRTREEKIRDEAVCFITRCKALSRHYDEVKIKEIPIKNIMERMKCFNREKLKKILINDNWEVTTNADGYEVVILPDSESEDGDDDGDDDSWSKHSKDNGELAQNNCDPKYDNTLTNDEDWGCDKKEPNVLINSTVGDLMGDFQWPVDKIVSSSNSSLVGSNIECITCAQQDITTTNDPLDSSLSEKSSVTEALVPDLSVVCDRSNSCQKVEKDSNEDYSVYETPLDLGCRIRNSKCESLNSSAQSVCCNRSENFSGCNKALSFETPNVHTEYDSTDMSFVNDSTNEQTKTNSFCCVSNISSTLDTSTYATPCCSQLHKKYIPKCLSLQQINAHYASPSINTELENSSSEQTLISKQKDKMSKSMEGFKTQESCDVHETCSNTSKVVDSGYPDSYSEHNMDMDLTPEQFDDIETESEGNDVSSRSLSPVLPPAPQIPRMIDDVENGDVANNNRDGEGNNMVADMEEEPLEFEAQIEEVNNEVQNLAGADLLDQEFQQVFNKPKSLEQDQESSSRHYCSSPESVVEEKHLSSSLLLQTSSNHEATESFSEKDKATSESQEHSSFSPPPNNPMAKGSKSGSSIVTSSSWSHLDSSESQPFFDVKEGVCKTDNKVESYELKAHNSLTTVLDGCSNISNCSLVRPVNKDNNSYNELIEAEDSNGSMFSKRVLSMDSAASECSRSTEGRIVTKENKTLPLFHPSLQQDNVSLPSVYQSTGSLSSSTLDLNADDSDFPEWLLDIQITDTDENELARQYSVMTVWDSDSFDELDGLNYDVQVDVRGGGDPQREAWN